MAGCIHGCNAGLSFRLCFDAQKSQIKGRCIFDVITLILSYCSLTQATDTSNIRLVFAAVKDTILHNALADSGIL